jgi:hypothetical protein
MPNGLSAVLHPVQAWRAYTATATAHADAEAIAAGLTVEDLGRRVRRYRDPALDQLADHRAHLAASHATAPYAAVRNSDDSTSADAVDAVTAGPWSTPTLITAGWSR